jgi:hypothetical protein
MLSRKYLFAANLFTLLASSACSNQIVDEDMDNNRTKACEQLTEGPAREDCMRLYQSTYEQYDRERRKIIGDKRPQPAKLNLPSEETADGSNN